MTRGLNARRVVGRLACAGVLVALALYARHILEPQPRAIRGWSIAQATPWVRVAAVEVFQRGQGRIGVLNTSPTVEGDPVHQYVLVDGRSVRLVYDGRKDRYGSGRIVQRTLDSISLGYPAPGETSPPRYVTVPLDSAGLHPRAPALLCWRGGEVMCVLDGGQEAAEP